MNTLAWKLIGHPAYRVGELPRRPVVAVSGRGLPPGTPTWWYRKAFREMDRDVTFFAWPGLHWAVRFVCNTLPRLRWYHIRVGLDLGVVSLDEGGQFSSARWTWTPSANPRNALRSGGEFSGRTAVGRLVCWAYRKGLVR